MQRKIIPDVVHDQALVHLGVEATAQEAAGLMRERNVGAILIMEGSRLLGIFTERDVVCRVVAERRDPEATTLGAVMTRNPDTAVPDMTALDALRLMQDGGYRHLPVVSRGKVVGVVSRRDFVGIEKAQLDEETATWERIG